MSEEMPPAREAAIDYRTQSSEPDVPPGYKRTEVGVIPGDWEILRIKDIAFVATGNTPPTSDSSNYGDEIAFVSPADIGEPKYIHRSEKQLSKKGAALSRKFPKHSVLFVCIGSTIGKCGIAPFELTSNQQINAIFPSEGSSAEFLYYAICMASRRIKEWAGEQAVPIVNKTQFSETVIQFPSISEQRAIATALSDADALIESLDRLIAKKRAIKQGAMQQLLTGKTRLPGFTGPWETAPFDKVLTRLNAKAHQIQASDYRRMGRYPVVDQGKERIVGFSDRHDICFECPDSGVIVFGDHTCIVKFIDFNFLVGADGTQVMQAKDGQSTRFHAYQLQHKGVEPTGYNRHFKFLKELDFFAPPSDEQSAIAGVLSDMDAEISALERRRDKGRQIKQGMMQQLLTGRVRLVGPERAAATGVG